MPDPAGNDVDPIEELRLRRWARENYVPMEDRHSTWDPIVLDEMLRKDRELSEALSNRPNAGLDLRSTASYVPLAPGDVYYVHGEHGRPQPARQASTESVPFVR